MTGRCPFVRAVAAGRLEEARQLAQEGPDPAEDAIIPTLIGWAQAAADGDPSPFGHG